MAESGWLVYLIEARDGTLYTGCTNDLSRRLRAHADGRGAKYLRGRGPLKVVWTEAQSDRSAAMKREWAIKGLSRRAKLRLIADQGQPKK